MLNLKNGKLFLPYNPQLVTRAKEMRQNPSPAERKLWGFLRTFPLKMWRQKPINHFIVDFYCPKLKCNCSPQQSCGIANRAKK